MAKPGSALVHATGVNYPAGPAAGFATKVPIPSTVNGLVPGDELIPEYLNDILSFIATWTLWNFDGTSADDATAHVVETDSSGNIHLLGGTFGGQPVFNGGFVSNDETIFNEGVIFENNGTISIGVNGCDIVIENAVTTRWGISFFKLGGTGTTAGNDVYVHAQDAQNTAGGGAHNNHGSVVEIAAGRPSQDGSGDPGGVGSVHILGANAQGNDFNTGLHILSINGPVGATSTKVFVTRPMFGVDRDGLITLEWVARRNDGGDHRYAVGRSVWYLEVDPSGRVDAYAVVGDDPSFDQENFATGGPTVTPGPYTATVAGINSSQLEFSVNNPEAFTMEFAMKVEILLTEII